MVEEWLPWALANKDGHGNGTGTIPEGAMQVVCESVTSSCRC